MTQLAILVGFLSLFWNDSYKQLLNMPKNTINHLAQSYLCVYEMALV